MSHYTTEVRYICEEAAGLDESKGFNNVDNILNASAPRIFDFGFPIFDENYRLVLEKKILKHYYTREICAETVGLWKLWLDARMNEIMPYYNKLYESELLEFNPFYDADYTRTIDRDKTGSEDNTNSRTNSVMGTHTGTVVDDGSNNLAQTGTIVADTEHTGTVTDAVQERGTIVEDTEHTGTITDRLQQTGTVAKDIDSTEDMDGTVTDDIDSTLRKTGTINTDDDTTNTRTDNLHATDARHDKNDRWDYFNDTPQGGINGVEDLEYLTNVRHIVDDGTGSGGTLDNTGTQTNVKDATILETRNTTDTTDTVDEKTYDTQKTIDATETQTFNKTDTNTKTLNNEDEKTTTFNKDTTDLKTMNNEDETTTTFNKNDNRDIDNTRTYNEATSESTSNSELLNKQIASEEDYLEHVVGKFPGRSYAQLLKEFRETFLNIDMMIIEELADLFMLIY